MKVILSGHGRMGRMVEEMLTQAGDQILGVLDRDLFESPDQVPGGPQVIIDFSHPSCLPPLLDFAERTGCALVLGTTGYAPAQMEQIKRAAQLAPIVQSSNYSLGVYLLKKAVAAVAPQLMEAGFDVEIVETHHNKKVDAPSGTAKLLLQAIDPEEKRLRVYGREGMTGPRGNEIGVHALRGGTVAGEHSVCFFGEDETLELRHSAASRRIFAAGAVRAARFALGRAPGLYGMDDVMGGKV